MIEGLDLTEVKAKNAAKAKVGDQVQLTLNTKAKMKGMFVLYIFPVLGLLVGAFSAEGLSTVLGLSNSTGLVLFTLCGLILAVLLGRFVGKRMEARQELTPSVSRVLRRSNRGVSHLEARPAGCPCGLSHGVKSS
jgi:sigma-E factor negative regulatory protein RseC